MGRIALAVGGIVLIGAGIAIATEWNWHWSTKAQVDRELAQRIDTVQLDTGSGDVRILAEDVATTTVHQRFSYTGGKPGDAFTVEGGKLVLHDCGNRCDVDYEVVVPRGVAVTGKVTSGETTVRGAAAADVTSTSGNVLVTDATGPVKVRATSGDVTVAMSMAQNVKVDVTSGNVMVTVPRDRYRVRTGTSSGTQRVDIATDPAGPYELDLNSTSGDVTVSPA
ncbi:DUF4097 family beta strand repeat-containing protein [Amycolatopsis rhizosphaerae]|nr:DUF4097 family beta strand repeat-containing protein [Amycolatopsis rhizosphaerae]